MLFAPDVVLNITGHWYRPTRARGTGHW